MIIPLMAFLIAALFGCSKGYKMIMRRGAGWKEYLLATLIALCPPVIAGVSAVYLEAYIRSFF